MKHDIFLSHAHQDFPFAIGLVDELEANGLMCWVAPRDIPAGNEYAEVIVDAIKNARCIVVLCSSASNLSKHVLREVERALTFHIQIIPIRLDDSPLGQSLEYYLSTLQFLDNKSLQREESVKRLAQQIKQRLLSGAQSKFLPLNENEYLERIKKLRNNFYISGENPEKLILEANELIPIRLTEEPLLIEVVSLCRAGKKEEAKHVLVNIFSMDDKAEEDWIRRSYDMFVSTYNNDSGMSAFTNETFFFRRWEFYNVGA